MKINMPYGNDVLEIEIPQDRILGILENRRPAAKNAGKLLLKALRHKNIPFGKKKVLVVVPDATRSAHLKEMLPVLLDKISIPSRSIDIMIATGLHRKHTPKELARLLGHFILKRHKILQHDPSPASCADFGKTKYDIPATLDRAILDYDFIMSIGVIEPHLYAGYSGGAKTIAIGLAGEPTINATHGIRFLDNPRTNIGSIDGNPFQETLWDILGNIGHVFSISTVNNSNGKALKVFAGPVAEVFKKGVDFARGVFEVTTQSQADIVICGIGYPKDVNLYQASRAINYVVDVDGPVVKKGGVVIVAAKLPDDAGGSAAEQRFYAELKDMRSPQDFVSRVRVKGCVAGEHRAYMVAKALMDYNIIFVSMDRKSFMKGLPFEYYDDMQKALQRAQDIRGKSAKIYIIPRSLATIARCE